MDPRERGRKRRDMVAPREEQGSVPPPPRRRRRERHELDPEMLWDSETDDRQDDYEGEDDDLEADRDWDEVDGVVDDLDDWDHPIRRLKIN